MSFDWERTLQVLEKLAQQHNAVEEDVAAIESAAKALHYIHDQDRLDDFREYVRDFGSEAEVASRTGPAFNSMSEAMDWLRAQSEPRYGTTVTIAGAPHVVVRERPGIWILTPAPSYPPPYGQQ